MASLERPSLILLFKRHFPPNPPPALILFIAPITHLTGLLATQVRGFDAPESSDILSITGLPTYLGSWVTPRRKSLSLGSLWGSQASTIILWWHSSLGVNMQKGSNFPQDTPQSQDGFIPRCLEESSLHPDLWVLELAQGESFSFSSASRLRPFPVERFVVPWGWRQNHSFF